MTQPYTPYDNIFWRKENELFQNGILSALGTSEANDLRDLLGHIRDDNETIERSKPTSLQKNNIDLVLKDLENNITKPNTALWKVLTELTPEQSQLPIADIRKYADLLSTNHDLFYTQQWKVDVTKILRWLKWDEQTESSEHIGMSEKLIQEAIGRNKKYKRIYKTDEEVREICSKLNYTRESLSNGREKHTINGKVFSFPKKNEFIYEDMKDKRGNFTMDIVSENGKKRYEIFQNETGMNRLSPEKVYELLWEFATAIGITSLVDYDFFKWGSAESQWLLQMFRNITGFEGEIPLNIMNNWNVVEHLYCSSNICYFSRYSYGNYNAAFLSGL